MTIIIIFYHLGFYYTLYNVPLKDRKNIFHSKAVSDFLLVSANGKLSFSEHFLFKKRMKKKIYKITVFEFHTMPSFYILIIPSVVDSFLIIYVLCSIELNDSIDYQQHISFSHLLYSLWNSLPQENLQQE